MSKAAPMSFAPYANSSYYICNTHNAVGCHWHWDQFLQSWRGLESWWKLGFPSGVTSSHLREHLASLPPCSSSSCHVTRLQTSLLMFKWNILQRDQCLCVRVKRTMKQHIPISFLLLHSPLLYPFSSLQTNRVGRSVSRQIDDEKSISWQRDSLAPPLFGLGLRGMLQSGYRSKINIRTETTTIQMNYKSAHSVLSAAASRTTTWLYIMETLALISLLCYFKLLTWYSAAPKLALNNNMPARCLYGLSIVLQC